MPMLQLEELAYTAGHMLKRHQLKITTAESCTGGMLAMVITAIAGSSAWFERGWVTYSNAAKQAELAVPPTIFEAEGAVSEACVLAMARGAVAHSDAHISVAISGVAGPTGGTDDKPVGTVWIAWGQKLGHAEAQRFQFAGGRRAVREQATQAALEGVIARLRS